MPKFVWTVEYVDGYYPNHVLEVCRSKAVAQRVMDGLVKKDFKEDMNHYLNCSSAYSAPKMPRIEDYKSDYEIVKHKVR